MIVITTASGKNVMEINYYDCVDNFRRYQTLISVTKHSSFNLRLRIFNHKYMNSWKFDGELT